MFTKIKEFFLGKPAAETQAPHVEVAPIVAESAPYKIPEPSYGPVPIPFVPEAKPAAAKKPVAPKPRKQQFDKKPAAAKPAAKKPAAKKPV